MVNIFSPSSRWDCNHRATELNTIKNRCLVMMNLALCCVVIYPVKIRTSLRLRKLKMDSKKGQGRKGKGETEEIWGCSCDYSIEINWKPKD